MSKSATTTQTTEARFSRIKPTFSRWKDGWLISMTHINGWEVVQYPGERPFVLSADEWHALPEHAPYRQEWDR